MLFDIQGKRRRVVQATYLALAVLMGGGLVLFGIGGDISGGLVDGLSGSGGGSDNGNSVVEKRVKSSEKKLKTRPTSVAARKSLTRDYYQLAVAGSNVDGTFSEDAKANLRKAGANWQAYVKLESENPDVSLARVALQIYDPAALNRPGEAKQTAQLVASKENSTAAYLALVQYATLDKDTRTADLAGQKAIDLAPAAQKKQVRTQVKQFKMPQGGAQAQGAQPSQ